MTYQESRLIQFYGEQVHNQDLNLVGFGALYYIQRSSKDFEQMSNLPRLKAKLSFLDTAVWALYLQNDKGSLSADSQDPLSWAGIKKEKPVLKLNSKIG